MEIWGKLEDKTWSYSFTVFDVLPNWPPPFHWTCANKTKSISGEDQKR